MDLDQPKRRNCSAASWIHTVFRLLTFASSIPLLGVTAYLVHNWPYVFRKAGVAMAGALVAMISDALAIKLFWSRSKAFPSVVGIDIAAAVLAGVGIFCILLGGFHGDDGDDSSSIQVLPVYGWERAQALGYVLAFVVCAIRIVSIVINAVLSCILYIQRSRRRERQQELPTQQLY